MDENTRTRRLRWQRNAAGVFAVSLVLVGFGLSLPKSLARYRALRSAQAELVDLQLQITRAQSQIVNKQLQITLMQQEIAGLQAMQAK